MYIATHAILMQSYDLGYTLLLIQVPLLDPLWQLFTKIIIVRVLSKKIIWVAEEDKSCGKSTAPNIIPLCTMLQGNFFIIKLRVASYCMNYYSLLCSF